MRTIGRTALLLLLVCVTVTLAVIVEIVVDRLTVEARDLNHLLKHSLGNVGTLMMALALFGYQAKKRFKDRFPGKLKDWLTLHEWFALIGAGLVAIHTGAHFEAAAPIAAMALTLVLVTSGLIGRRVYLKAKKEIASHKTRLSSEGLSRDEIEERLAFETAAASTLAHWRTIHMPMATIFLAVVMLHIVAALFFGG